MNVWRASGAKAIRGDPRNVVVSDVEANPT